MYPSALLLILTFVVLGYIYQTQQNYITDFKNGINQSLPTLHKTGHFYRTAHQSKHYNKKLDRLPTQDVTDRVLWSLRDSWDVAGWHSPWGWRSVGRSWCQCVGPARTSCCDTRPWGREGGTGCRGPRLRPRTLGLSCYARTRPCCLCQVASWRSLWPDPPPASNIQQWTTAVVTLSRGDLTVLNDHR